MGNFKPVRLTHPKDKFEDVIATTAVDKNNFIARDGYTVAEDQSGINEETGTAEPDKETGSDSKAKSKKGEGKATDAAGDPVQTA